MPIAQEEVEEKQEAVCACPMAMMDAAHAGICCHLWTCSEVRVAPERILKQLGCISCLP